MSSGGTVEEDEEEEEEEECPSQNWMKGPIRVPTFVPNLLWKTQSALRHASLQPRERQEKVRDTVERSWL